MSERNISPFDFIRSISQQNSDLMERSRANSDELDPEDVSNQYNPFMINRGLSQFADTTLAANEMNIHNHLPAKMQYDFLRSIIRPRKRYSGKWAKQKDRTQVVELLMRKYTYSRDRAEEVVDILTKEQQKEIIAMFDEGGVLKKSKSK